MALASGPGVVRTDNSYDSVRASNIQSGMARMLVGTTTVENLMVAGERARPFSTCPTLVPASERLNAGPAYMQLQKVFPDASFPHPTITGDHNKIGPTVHTKTFLFRFF